MGRDGRRVSFSGFWGVSEEGKNMTVCSFGLCQKHKLLPVSRMAF